VILYIIAGVAILVSAIVTFNIAKNQKGRSEKDYPVNSAIAKHPVRLNPVFLTYVGAGVILLAVLGVLAYAFYF
jgi:hypothetical protein